MIVAVHPVRVCQSKRDTASRLGATHAVETMAQAQELIAPLTNGQGADSCIVCVGVTDGSHVAAGVEAVRKAGIVS